MEVALPPEPAGQRPRTCCPHDYTTKRNCPMCYPCPGGHGKIKWKCGICKGTVLEPVEKRPRKLCPHDYSARRNCPMCYPCPGGHGKRKGQCGICKGTVVYHDPTAVPQRLSVETTATEDFPAQLSVEPEDLCTHTRNVGGCICGFASRRLCPICSALRAWGLPS